MMGRDEVFAGKRLGCFEIGKPLPDPDKHAIFLSVSYGCCADANQNLEFAELFDAFIQPLDCVDVDTLVIGMWGESGDSSEDVINMLVTYSSCLPNLKALFIGNISQEENEISWIEHGDISPLYAAFPQLTTLKIRGGQGLQLGSLQHTALQTLVIESGGLGKGVLAELMAADLPALRHLELWLGDENYGNNGSPTDLAPLLEGEIFSQLQYLGLRNADTMDEIAKVVAVAPLVKRLQVLDLSLSNLTDEGGQALLLAAQEGQFANLQLLDLHHHYLSDDMLASLQALPLKLDLGEQLEPETYGNEVYRMIFVSE